MLFECDAHLRMLPQESGEVVGQEGMRRVRVRPQRDVSAHPFGVGGEIGVHLFDLGEHLAGVAQQRLAGAGEDDAACAPFEERRTERLLEQMQSMAGRGGCQLHAGGAARQVLLFGNGDKKSQINKVVAHGGPVRGGEAWRVRVRRRLVGKCSK